MPQVVPPTDFEKSDYPKHPGIQRYGKMIRFATIGPVKAGWLVKEKGKWYLTEEGKKAYARFVDPDEFRRESSRLYYQWRDKQPKEANGAEEFPDEIGTSERVADASSTLEEAEETAWKEIEEYLQGINPYDLQKLVAALLRAMGLPHSMDLPSGT
jgi:restriction system protein